MSEKIFAVIPVAPVSQSAVSRAVLALEKVGLVECLTPDEKMDRYYRITDTGKKVAEIIEGKGEIIFRGFDPLPLCLAGQITGTGIFPAIDPPRGALRGGGRSSQPEAWGHQPPSKINY